MQADWRRRGALVATGVVVLAIAVIVPVLHSRGRSTPRPRLASQLATTTVAPTTTALPTTTAAPSTTAMLVRTTTTRDHCRSSKPPYSEGPEGYSNPLPASCGPFTWDPAPSSNQPATVTVTFAPATPRVGEPVTFHVAATDPDASPVQPGCYGNPSTKTPDYGDGTGTTNGCIWSCPHDYERYGRWPPPRRERGSLNQDFTHTYTSSGTFTVNVVATSGLPCRLSVYDPYWSDATATVTVTVAPA